ncbi:MULTISPECIES: WXG100 family type VII secretion target [unclassified Saccharothrix]|uniref:WXG100 family type VII secretion target n=1 Tax=unclassified Saccharothrix TaxID=2593673 RepID=UPI00307E3262
MNDRIEVNFGELASAAGNISSQASQVEQQLEDLKARLAPVIAQWDGGASEAYQEAQRKWDTSAADLQSVLASIGVAVQQATEAYEAAENTNRGRW